MEISELKIFSANLDEQEDFYDRVLGFKCCRKSDAILKIFTKENVLIMEKSKSKTYYHFAFMISPKSLERAISYLENRSVELLPYRNDKIIFFDQGRAIYFYDRDGNIVEFIERPGLGYKSSLAFSIKNVLKLNEIGLPVENPLGVARQLMNEFNIEPLNQNAFNDLFCWVGDHNGVIIVVKRGRNWLPTEKPGIRNDFAIKLLCQDKEVSIIFRNNTISSLFGKGLC